MILLDGKTLSQKILSDLKQQIENFNLKINLDIILVGDDPNSLKYVALKQKRAAEVGIGGEIHRLSSTISESEASSLINKLNNDPLITGFFTQLPLPQNFHKNQLLSKIDPHKDADGLVSNSGVTPAVVRGIIRLLDEYKLSFAGKKVAIINDSQLIGQPLKNHFESRHSEVILCNDQTENLLEVTKTADLLISATGVANIITGDMIKDSVVVVDVATGDVDFASVSPKSSYITPTIGGVGPMTVASLLQNVFDLAVEK